MFFPRKKNVPRRSYACLYFDFGQYGQENLNGEEILTCSGMRWAEADEKKEHGDFVAMK